MGGSRGHHIGPCRCGENRGACLSHHSAQTRYYLSALSFPHSVFVSTSSVMYPERGREDAETKAHPALGAQSCLRDTKYIFFKMGLWWKCCRNKEVPCPSEPLQRWLRSREGLPGKGMPQPALAGHVDLSPRKQPEKEAPHRVHRPMARAKALRFGRARLWGKAVFQCGWKSRVCGGWGSAEGQGLGTGPAPA